MWSWNRGKKSPTPFLSSKKVEDYTTKQAKLYGVNVMKKHMDELGPRARRVSVNERIGHKFTRDSYIKLQSFAFLESFLLQY